MTQSGPSTQPVMVMSMPLASGAAQDGADITSPVPMPAGGVGIRGWLSAIWTKLNGTLGVNVGNFPGTQAVTGTFWPPTQPVSGTVNTGLTQPLTDAQLRAAAVPVTGSGAAGTPATGVQTVQGITNGTPQNVLQAPLTKGTQGPNGVTTQDLKDAGRGLVTYYSVIPVLATATDVLQSLTGTKAGATVAATTTPAVVTAGKTLRIQRFWATYIATATSGYGIVRLRYNPAGVVAITSPVLQNIAVGASTPATANATAAEDAVIPDGLEVPAGTGIGISVQGFAAATPTAVGYILCGVSGYEY